MSKNVIRVTPVGGFDIPELENWLAAMSKKGLRFSMTAGILTIFERTEQRIVQIHLEPIRGTAEDDPELNALYEDAGWQYWGIFRGSFYVFASDDLTAQAYVPTQYIVDFIKSIEHNDEQEYDGIEYNSTTNPGGYNLAIFNPDLFECVSVSVYDIEKLQYTSKRVL